MSSKREQLIETAIELFAEHGYHATGIDRIAAAAHVTKKTMYHHFRSKDELILAALREHDTRFRNDFMKRVEARSDDPVERLFGIFEVAQAWFDDNRFYGCMFINAVGEYSAPNTAIRSVCREYKQLMFDYIEKLARDAQLPQPQVVAGALAMLLEGAIVTAQVSGVPDAAQTARQAAELIVGRLGGAASPGANEPAVV